MATTGADEVPILVPRKVHQDDFRPGRGNALQAAVASIFGLELSQVPNFVELPEGYEAAIQSFCAEKGWTSLKLKMGEDTAAPFGEEYEGKLCVLRGKSPRGDSGHVVVAARRTSKDGCGFEMIHDPHPDETFLDESEAFGWCMFFDEKDSAAASSELPAEDAEWPELLGKTCSEAETFLRETYGPKLEIVVVGEGSMVTMDYRIDRVRLYVDEMTNTTITQVPRVG